MFRRLIGVITAVAAAGLLVGTAWASGDEAGRDSNPASSVVSGGSYGSSSVTQATASGGTIEDDRTSTSVEDRTVTSMADSATTRPAIENGPSTSTSLDSTTSTTRDEDSSSSTSSTIDDHTTVPVTTDPRTYDVGGAGSVSVQLVSGKLVLVDARATSGWSLEVDKDDGRDIRVEIENGDSDARFEAKIRHGEVRVEIRRD
jgi:hypothetical protein